MRKSFALMTMLVAAVLGLSACGSSGNDPGDGGSSEPTTMSGMPMTMTSESMNSETMSSAPMTMNSETMSGGTMSGEPMTSSMPMTMTSGTDAAAAPMITINDFAYDVSGPVSAGATVSVKNNDDVAHTVTSDSGNQFAVKVSPGSTATFTAPATAGTYKFHCKYHANMHGKLVVQ